MIFSISVCASANGSTAVDTKAQQKALSAKEQTDYSIIEIAFLLSNANLGY